MDERRRIPLTLHDSDPHRCSPKVRIGVLGQVPFFVGLTAEQLSQINNRCRAQGFEAAAAVYHAGSTASRLYVVATGIIKTTRLTAEGRETLLDVLTPGDFLGSLPALGQEQYADSAWALTPACLLGLEAGDYTGIMEQFPSVAMATLKRVSQRLSESQQAVHLLSGSPLEQRLAATLLLLVAKVGEPWGGATLLQVPLSRDDLAAMTGAATESVSRLLSSWRRTGLIETGRRWIAVRDCAALAKLRDG